MDVKKVLAIETSCDDTSVAIVDNTRFVHVCLSANQDLDHKPFAGVVPEIAGRSHTLSLLPLVDKTLSQSNLHWDDISGIVVTSRPRLVGSLMVGVVTAKTLSMVKNKPFIGVNHLEGHILAPFLRDNDYEMDAPIEFPYLALAVSGGHTSLYLVHEFGRYELLGRTIDDAAGEAFDKLAKFLRLGFPGGPNVDRIAQNGNKSAYQFPRALVREDNYNFSFSGLKTAVMREVEKMSDFQIQTQQSDLCASFQEAIVDVLLVKLFRASKRLGISKILLTGGVAANSSLREQAKLKADKNKVELYIPPLRYCTDNAAMIGLTGLLRLNKGETSNQSLGPSPRSFEGDFYVQ